MRIALVLDKMYPFYNGGYERAFYEIAKLLSLENEVVLFTTENTQVSNDESGVLDFLKPGRGKGISLHKIAENQTYSSNSGVHTSIGALKYYFFMRLVLKHIRLFDVVILNTIPYFGIGNLSRRLMKTNGAVVSLFNEAWYHYPEGTVKSWFRRAVIRRSIKKIVRNSDGIVSVSKATNDSLVENYKAEKDKSVVIPSGIGSTSTKVELMPVSSRENDIIFVGRISIIKHLDDLLKAIVILKKENFTVNAIIVGEGHLLGYYSKFCITNHIEDQVVFAGYVSEEAKKHLLERSKLFVMPSEREGFSLATLEAMRFGCVPVVALPKYKELFGIGQYLENGYNGMTFEWGNCHSLAHTIKFILTNGAELSRFQENAYSTAIEYTWENSGNELIRYLENLRK